MGSELTAVSDHHEGLGTRPSRYSTTVSDVMPAAGVASCGDQEEQLLATHFSQDPECRNQLCGRQTQAEVSESIILQP